MILTLLYRKTKHRKNKLLSYDAVLTFFNNKGTVDEISSHRPDLKYLVDNKE